MRLRLLRWVWTRRARYIVNALFALFFLQALLGAVGGWTWLRVLITCVGAYLITVLERRADLPRRQAPDADQLLAALLDGVRYGIDSPPPGLGIESGDAIVNIDDQLAAVRRVVAGQPVEGDRCPTS